jgi:hypothetical protein
MRLMAVSSEVFSDPSTWKASSDPRSAGINGDDVACPTAM